jgi:hypothetical protein
MLYVLRTADKHKQVHHTQIPLISQQDILLHFVAYRNIQRYYTALSGVNIKMYYTSR